MPRGQADWTQGAYNSYTGKVNYYTSTANTTSIEFEVALAIATEGLSLGKNAATKTVATGAQYSVAFETN